MDILESIDWSKLSVGVLFYRAPEGGSKINKDRKRAHLHAVLRGAGMTLVKTGIRFVKGVPRLHKSDVWVNAAHIEKLQKGRPE